MGVIVRHHTINHSYLLNTFFLVKKIHRCIFLTIRLSSFNIKNKKGVWKGYNFFIWAHNNLLPHSPLSDLQKNWPCFLEEPCYSQRKDFLLDLSSIILMHLLHQLITESIQIGSKMIYL